MKKLITIMSIVAIVFASCTSSKNGFAIKRKYNKGYYVSNSHKVHSKSTKTEDAKPTEAKVVNDEVASIKIDLPTIETANLEMNATIASVESHSTKKADKQIKHNTIITDTKNTFASAVKTYIKTQAKDLKVISKKTNKGSSDSDLNLIIMVILCLFPFINLIPVFIKDGKDFTLNFWVTLILDCLFFLPGIIFALLVVLDVVNLA